MPTMTEKEYELLSKYKSCTICKHRSNAFASFLLSGHEEPLIFCSIACFKKYKALDTLLQGK